MENRTGVKEHELGATDFLLPRSRMASYSEGEKDTHEKEITSATRFRNARDRNSDSGQPMMVLLVCE